MSKTQCKKRKDSDRVTMEDFHKYWESCDVIEVSKVYRSIITAYLKRPARVSWALFGDVVNIAWTVFPGYTKKQIAHLLWYGIIYNRDYPFNTRRQYDYQPTKIKKVIHRSRKQTLYMNTDGKYCLKYFKPEELINILSDAFNQEENWARVENNMYEHYVRDPFSMTKVYSKKRKRRYRVRWATLGEVVNVRHFFFQGYTKKQMAYLLWYGIINNDNFYPDYALRYLRSSIKVRVKETSENYLKRKKSQELRLKHPELNWPHRYLYDPYWLYEYLSQAFEQGEKWEGIEDNIYRNEMRKINEREDQYKQARKSYNALKKKIKELSKKENTSSRRNRLHDRSRHDSPSR